MSQPQLFAPGASNVSFNGPLYTSHGKNTRHINPTKFMQLIARSLRWGELDEEHDIIATYLKSAEPGVLRTLVGLHKPGYGTSIDKLIEPTIENMGVSKASLTTSGLLPKEKEKGPFSPLMLYGYLFTVYNYATLRDMSDEKKQYMMECLSIIIADMQAVINAMTKNNISIDSCFNTGQDKTDLKTHINRLRYSLNKYFASYKEEYNNSVFLPLESFEQSLSMKGGMRRSKSRRSKKVQSRTASKRTHRSKKSHRRKSHSRR